MPTALMPTNSLETEIERLKSDLEIAVASQVTPGAKREQELRRQLSDARAELFRQRELESQVLAEQQRATDLVTLCELEKRAMTAKNNLDIMKRAYGQLQMQIQKSEFEHGILLGQYARLKQSIGV